MKPRQQASRAALEMIERFEGYRRTAARLDDGRWTIGYGHTKTTRPGVEVSEADAEALLIYDLMEVSGALNEWVYTPLSQNQFDALCSFVFNIGTENFRHSSVLRRLNEGALLQAACAMEMWRRVDFEGEPIVLDALVRRRAAEKALFLTPLHGFLPAPSQVLRPRVDSDLTGHVPASRPVVIAADAITARLQSILAEEPAAPEPSPTPQPDPEPPVAEATPPVPPMTSPEAELDLPAPPEPPEPPGWTSTFESEPERADAEAAMEPQPFADLETGSLWPESSIAERAEPEPRLFAAEPMTFEDLESRRVAHHEFQTSELDSTPTEPIKGLNPITFWLGAGALGLVVFAAGIFFGFSAKNTGMGGVIGWGLGLVGIGFVATAVYFLLERLGGREEP